MADNRLGVNNSQQKLIGGGAPRPGTRASSTPKNEFFVGNTNEKRYLWTARAFAVITAISICCNIVLIIAITQVIPLFRVEPFLLTFQNKQEQVVNVVPIKNDMEKKPALPKSLFVSIFCCAVRLAVIFRKWKRAGCPAVLCRKCLIAAFMKTF